MVTKLAIDPDPIDKARTPSGEQTTRVAVTKAPPEFTARCEQKRALELFGALGWDADYNYKRERSRGSACSSIPASAPP